ncbi:MAG: hypothetical protein COB51_09555 [Moraxellaceae bacterium]|nr:MAG: hypothetical protein COB51_09555 [Moraxellaceae bacterium]
MYADLFGRVLTCSRVNLNSIGFLLKSKEESVVSVGDLSRVNISTVFNSFDGDIILSKKRPQLRGLFKTVNAKT